MTNNDILRRIRYTFDFSDPKMVEIFSAADFQTTREEVHSWLLKDDSPDFKKCKDKEMTAFLNGFINDRRGKKEGAQPEVEKRLTNNAIFMKLKIALNLKAEDVIEIMALAKFNISKHELSALFRKVDHKHYRECGDQVLRNFLVGLQMQHRPTN